ncbi:MAG: ATP-binding protein [Candidatus Sulfotelmatobacter sp.]
MGSSTISLSDADLLSRLKNFEDNFVERKTSGDNKDWLSAVVGFANSTPVGYPAVLFIGVRDDGTPEVGLNFESLQQSFTRKMQAAYPPIYFTTKMLGKDDSQFLAVIVPGSESRPHFAGHAYIRKGNRTETASEKQFEELLAGRLSKSGEILKWVNKTITIDFMVTEHLHIYGSVSSSVEQVVTACNAFYVTYASHIGQPGTSVPLRRVEVSNDTIKSRLKLEIYPA